MELHLRGLLLFLVFICFSRKIESSSEVMKTMFENFKKALKVCKKELDLPNSVDSEIIRFWQTNTPITNRDVGCMLTCLSEKINVLDQDGHIHHENAKDYAKQHGADETTAHRLVQLLESCSTSEQDNCLRALDIANCFKREISTLNWTPTFEEMVELVLDI